MGLTFDFLSLDMWLFGFEILMCINLTYDLTNWCILHESSILASLCVLHHNINRQDIVFNTKETIVRSFHASLLMSSWPLKDPKIMRICYKRPVKWYTTLQTKSWRLKTCMVLLQKVKREGNHGDGPTWSLCGSVKRLITPR